MQPATHSIYRASKKSFHEERSLWDLLSNDVLDHIAARGGIQTLSRMRLLHMRCKKLTSVKDRLSACRRLMDAPFKLRAAEIMGYKTSSAYRVYRHIGDGEMKFLAEALVGGALANLKWLNLYDNKIGDVGMSAFAQAVKPVSKGGSGALPNLTELNVGSNHIGDAGVTAFAQAITPVGKGGSGALPYLGTLALQLNRIGDVGMAAFAQAVKPVSEGGSGALPKLTLLGLNNNNKLGDAGMTAFAEAIKPVGEGGSGALVSLEDLYVDNGPLGTEHPALRAACEARCIFLR